MSAGTAGCWNVFVGSNVNPRKIFEFIKFS
jgi:hypothetical protein